jgi:hypothetical protein
VIVSLLKIFPGMCYEQMRITYTAGFKLNVMKYAKKHGNNTVKRQFVLLPTEK